jgi:hypothetical protein
MWLPVACSVTALRTIGVKRFGAFGIYIMSDAATRNHTPRTPHDPPYKAAFMASAQVQCA